jgi:hypothetical protein
MPPRPRVASSGPVSHLLALWDSGGAPRPGPPSERAVVCFDGQRLHDPLGVDAGSRTEGIRVSRRARLEDVEADLIFWNEDGAQDAKASALASYLVRRVDMSAHARGSILSLADWRFAATGTSRAEIS